MSQQLPAKKKKQKKTTAGLTAREILNIQSPMPLNADNPIKAQKAEKKKKKKATVGTKKQKKGQVNLVDLVNDKELAEAIGKKVLEAMLKK